MQFKTIFNHVTSMYGDYPTSDGLEPTAVASGTLDGTAVFGQSGPADITDAGGLSAYGIMGMGGNVLELEETTLDLSNSSVSSTRAYRGGSWTGGLIPSSDLFYLSASWRAGSVPSLQGSDVGFRVASLNSVPEPNSFALFGIAMLGMFQRRRRR